MNPDHERSLRELLDRLADAWLRGGCRGVQAFDGAEKILANVFKKAGFWEKHAGAAFNDRQRDMLVGC
jgi:hypothetical protein